MDIAEYTEKTLGIELMEYQKHILRETYKHGPDCKIILCKDNGRTNLRTMFYLANCIFGGNNNDSDSI